MQNSGIALFFSVNFFKITQATDIPHWYMPGRQRVTYEVPCLFLLLWACLIASGWRCFCKGTRKYNTPASNKRQVPFFCLLSFPAHGPSWDGGSWRGLCSWSARVVPFGSIFLWMAFMSRTTRVHVKSCSFSWQDFVWFRAVIFATLMFLQECTPHLCPSEFFFLSNPQGWCWVWLWGIPPALLPFSIKKQRQKRYFLRSLSTLLASVVFGYLQSLQEVWSFRVDFGSQVVLPPRRRWDLCQGQLRPSRRKPLREQFIFQKVWRCTAHRDVKQLKIVWRPCLSSLVDKVASMLLAMQALPMPRRALANVTGLFV